MSTPENTPPPAYDGTPLGSCAVCGRETNRGLAFTGTAEWVVQGLMALGIPQDRGVTMLSQATGCEPGMVPDGRGTFPVRVCQRCAADGAKGLEAGLVVDGLPRYVQPEAE